MASTSSREKKMSTRFYPALDVILVKQVLADWPVNDAHKWEALTQKINEALVMVRSDGTVTVRGCKDRLRKLLVAFKADELVSLRASGTEEDYGQRERLLGEIVELEAEGEKEKQAAAKAEQKKLKQGEFIRRKALQSLTEVSAGLTDEVGLQDPPLKKRKKFETNDYLQYLREKNDKECALKQQQHELDKQRFELDRQERKARIEHDAKMMEVMLKLTNKEQ